jgi:tyrosine-protein phosphatase YwqE
MADRLARLVRAGCLVQATAALVAEGPASEPLVDLARRGLVHVLGSDSHSARLGRPVRISDGLERLGEAERIQPHLEWIAEAAPAAILAGEEIEPPFGVN